MVDYNYSKLVYKLLGFSRQRLRYWRRIGLFEADQKLQNGYYLYGFRDLVALKTIKKLKEAGFSTHNITKSFELLKKRFPDVKNPFVDRPVIIYGSKIALIDNGKAFEALTGQSLFIDLKDIEVWLKNLSKKEPELFENKRELKEKRRAR